MIPELIRDAIAERGPHWNQVLLSVVSGYSEKHIAQVMTGNVRVTAIFAVKIARALGQDDNWAFTLVVNQAWLDMKEAIKVVGREEKAPEGS